MRVDRSLARVCIGSATVDTLSSVLRSGHVFSFQRAPVSGSVCEPPVRPLSGLCCHVGLDARAPEFLPARGAVFGPIIAVGRSAARTSMVRHGLKSTAAAITMVRRRRNTYETFLTGRPGIVDEDTLVRQCREGDREAQRALYERTSERVYRLLLKMTGNPDDAFDLAQETYLKAFTRIDQFDGRASLATWLYRIAVNEALQFLRRAKRTRVKTQEIATERHPEPDADQSMVRLDIQGALATLSLNDRAMLLLRYQEGLDYRAIAEVMDCAAGTVASRLNRARHGLRDILQKSYAATEEDDPRGRQKDGRKVSSEIGGDGEQPRIGS